MAPRTLQERIEQRLADLLTPEDLDQVVRVGAAVRSVLEELASESVVDPATISQGVQDRMAETRAALLLHRVCSDPTLCYLDRAERHEDSPGRVLITFSIPEWVSDHLGVLEGNLRIFDPGDSSAD